MDRGDKDDIGKLRYDLIPAEALEELARVYTYGAQKYAPHNWRKGRLYSTCFASICRHLWQGFWSGKDVDEESGCHHLAAVAFWCCEIICYWRWKREDLDDRVAK